MNPRSLVFRLVAWHALWQAAVFAMAGVLLFFCLRQYFEGNIAEIQLKRANRIARVITPAHLADRERLSKAITRDFAPEASGRFIRVYLPGGTIVYESGQPLDNSFDLRTISFPRGRPGIRIERSFAGLQITLATVAIGPADAPRFFVETGEPLTPALNELWHLLVSIIVGFAIVFFVGMAGGQQLIKRALQPIKEITVRAEGITSRNLSERLPVPTTGAEFEHLSLALNRMITRLDDAFQHNRRFLADASHELRTPLTILRGELDALAHSPALTDDLRTSAESLSAEVNRLSRIVENLFALSRLEAGLAQVANAPLDLTQLALTTAEQMCLLAADKHIAITSHAPAPVRVDGDAARLKQVIVNLLDNAIKYTAEGGSVRLSVFVHESFAVCEVTDTGVGIPAAAIPRLFDRFYRTDEARSRQIDGVGLGLAIVKSITHAHNGRIEVDSTVGKGSRFSLILPLSKFTPDNAHAPQSTDD